MLHAINDFVWGPVTLALLLGTGAYLTLRLHFLPWRRLGYALRMALGREARQAEGNGVSSFAALMTALAASIGTGNIVGVATALTAGGPGALVWMELSALLGMATIFAESLLAVRFRRRDRMGRWSGGPMYVLEAAFGHPVGGALGGAFALFAVGASLGIGSMTQSNSIAQALEETFSLSVWPVGAVTAALALAVILGGVERVAGVACVLVPVMGTVYLAAGLAVIAGNRGNLIVSLGDIFRCAFSPRAAAGGAAGWLTAARWGVARGVFSNEAGMGSAGISAAAAEQAQPVRQGYISMTGAFFDTVVICTVTGLAICCSGALGGGEDGAALTIAAFATVLGPWGARLVALSIALFAFATIVGWEYQGETAFAYLTRGRGRTVYRMGYALAAFLGAGMALETVFTLADVCNALMCLPNLLGLIAMSGQVRRSALAEIRPPKKPG